MFLLFLLLSLTSSVKKPPTEFWATDVGKFLGQKKSYLRAENVASYGGVYKYKYDLTKDKLTIDEVWKAFKPLNCKGVLANSRFFVVARVCYDEKAFSKKEVENGEIFVRYGGFSHLHDGRFEKIAQIRIQYFHVVLKAEREFILSEYSKPAEMMTWDEQTANIWETRMQSKEGDRERCVIVGPQKNYIDPKHEITVQHLGKDRESPVMHEGFKGKSEFFLQNGLSLEETDGGAPAYCFLFGLQKWKLFGFVSKPSIRSGIHKKGHKERFCVIESIFREFIDIKEEKPEFFEYAKPIWEQINENMIGRKELRQEL